MDAVSTIKSYKPRVLVDAKNLTEEEWLGYRRCGIGGSDAAAVLGVSPFKTARDIYYDKIGTVNLNDQDDTWVQKKVGHLLEDLVAEIFHVRTGFEIFQTKKMFMHPLHDFMLADVDYFIKLPNGETAILEIKTTNYNARDTWWRDGEEIVPLHYEIQGRHYMAVMNLNHVYYCCLYGNTLDETIIRHIERDLDYEQELIAIEEDFYQNNLLKRIPPEYIEDGDLVLQSVKNHHGGADITASAVELSFSGVNSVMRYLELQAKKSELNALVKKVDDEMKRMQAVVVDEMGRSCTATYNSGNINYTVTYNPIRKCGINKEDLFKLQMQYPDIYEQFASVSESRRFYVKQAARKAA